VEDLVDKKVKPALIHEAAASYNLFENNETIQLVEEEEA
jgi:hypothetical protein